MAIQEPRPRTRPRNLVDRRPIRDVPARPAAGSAPPPPPSRDWRNEIAGLSGLNVLAGIWLIIAPWVLVYSARDPRWNDVVFGAIIGILALTRATGAYRAEILSWINALIGVWLFIAAFTIDFTATAGWNDIILGIIVFLLAISSAEVTASVFPRRRG